MRTPVMLGVLAALVNGWGGISLVYRKSMHDSPAYRLNHEEIVKFLEEGVTFVENLAPIACEPDERGALSAVVLEKVVESEGRWRSIAVSVQLALTAGHRISASADALTTKSLTESL